MNTSECAARTFIVERVLPKQVVCEAGVLDATGQIESESPKGHDQSSPFVVFGRILFQRGLVELTNAQPYAEWGARCVRRFTVSSSLAVGELWEVRVDRRKCIVMAGPSIESMGGIAAVVRSYIRGGLFERWPVIYVSTYEDGTALTKLGAAIHGVVLYFGAIVTGKLRVLHVHSASRASFIRKSILVLTARLLGKPAIFHLHGAEFVDVYERQLGLIGRYYVRFVLKRCTRIIVLSDRWREMLRPIARTETISVIPNPVIGPLEVPAEIGREAGALVFMGRLGERKGIHLLIEAVSGLARDLEWKLYVGGDGDIDGVLAHVNRVGLADRIEVMGWVDEDEKAEILKRAAVLVLPSYAEGLPVSLLEAMAYAVPVVATPVGGIPDLIEAGREGLLVPVGDVQELRRAIDFLLRNADVARAMGRRGRTEYENKYSANVVIPTLEGVYQELGVDSRAMRRDDELR